MKLSKRPSLVAIKDFQDNTYNPFKKVPVLSWMFKSRRTIYFLDNEVSYSTEFGFDPLDIVIPREFKTDLASIPAPFSWFIRPNSYHIQVGALVHDYLCTKGSKVNIGGEFREVTKIEASKIFFQVLREQGNGVYFSLLLAIPTYFGRFKKNNQW